MPSHFGIASGLNLIPNNKKIFHLANDRFQSNLAVPIQVCDRTLAKRRRQPARPPPLLAWRAKRGRVVPGRARGVLHPPKRPRQLGV